MFSGFTNQFTSLVGAVKGGQADEDVPAPTPEQAAAAAAAAEAAAAAAAASSAAATELDAAAGEQPVEGEEAAKRSSNLVDSLLTEATGWLGSAKGWLGSASIPSMPAMPTMAMPSMPAMPTMPAMPSIPGLRKSGAEAAEGAADGAEQTDLTGAGAGPGAGGAVSGDDDDKSRYISATEGADSHPASGGGTPTGGEEGQIGQGKDDLKITTKVTQQAKHFGSFLSSAINKAGAKIKETVKDNTILDSFNKEQEAFIKGQGGSDSGAAPWIGHANEAKIKEEILGLSQDRRNFVRAPPAGVDFEFNYDTAYPTAIAIMAEDKALETMRFELVPKIITEENFWRNYFYRVSLIIQAAELGTLGADGVGQASSGEDAILPTNVTTSETKNPNTPNASGNNSNSDTQANSANEINSKRAAGENANSPASSASAKASEKNAAASLRAKISESEFVSETFQQAPSTETELQEIKDGMRKLGIDSMTQQAFLPAAGNDEEQWEKDLEAELKDYEVVGGSGRSSSSKIGSGASGGGGGRGGGAGGGGRGSGSGANVDENDGEDDDDELPTISNLRTRSTNNDWEEYADLIEDTDDLKNHSALSKKAIPTPLGHLEPLW